MPDTIVFISCVKSKRSTPCTAKDMYISPFFRGMIKYAQKLQPQKIFILSAEYGLLKLNDLIVPYEKTLNRMKAPERSAWAARVLSQLRQEADLDEDRFIFLAGVRYREGLLPHIKNYEVPMKSLRQGEQVKWLKEQVAV